MKSRYPLILTCLFGLILALFVRSKRSVSSSADESTPTVRSKRSVSSSADESTPTIGSTRRLTEMSSSENLNNIPVKAYPDKLPDFRKSHRDDPEATLKLINIISRHPRHTERLIFENQWIKRREIVEQKESFRELAGRLLAGEDISEFQIPLFDGETATFIIDHDRSELTSEEVGVIRGHVKGEPNSIGNLVYFNNSDTGTVILPNRGFSLELEPWGHRRLIVKDYYAGEFARAVPCSQCQQQRTPAGHSQHE